jgi:hypothetical protein
MSYADELAARKRRYGVLMGLRLPCMVLAALCYNTPWLAVSLLVLSIPLPWIAVIIANDRLVPKRRKIHRYSAGHRELEAQEHPVIEG